MPFKFCESYIEERYTLGYTVFRRVIPASLLRDLRKACARVHEIARKSGPRAMRLTGVARHGLDCQAFTDYRQLPALIDAITRVLGARHEYGDTDSMAILIETADIPICQAWHRDAREHELLEEHRAEFTRMMRIPAFINQVNAPLYDDPSLWYVPGSHLRGDFPAETAACKSTILAGDNLTDEDREQRGIEYCRAMPGAVCLAMDAGDFAMYHPCAWHLGSVLPYRKRATIHDTVHSPESRAWYAKWNGWKKEKAELDRAAATATVKA